MNLRPPLPQSGALPAALHPEILPCFPQSHYIIALDFQNVNRFVKNCCTTFSKNLFFFCGILTKSPRWAGLREFSPFNWVPDAAFSVRLLPFFAYPPPFFLPVAPAPLSPDHSTARRSRPAVSIPFYRPSLPPRRLHAIILSALPFYSSPFPPSATVAQCRTPTNCDKMLINIDNPPRL